jgi:hypothetical protein
MNHDLPLGFEPEFIDSGSRHIALHVASRQSPQGAETLPRC